MLEQILYTINPLYRGTVERGKEITKLLEVAKIISSTTEILPPRPTLAKQGAQIQLQRASVT